METLVITNIENIRVGFPAALVKRVVWAVFITKLPGQNSKFKGVINVEDEVIPVIDIRNIVGLPSRPLHPDNDIVIVECAEGLLGIVADRVEEVAHFEASQLSMGGEKLESCASAVVKAKNGLIVVVDPAKLISDSDIPEFKKLIAAQAV